MSMGVSVQFRMKGTVLILEAGQPSPKCLSPLVGADSDREQYLNKVPQPSPSERAPTDIVPALR